MRESRTYGSVRGALSNERPYRDRCARNDDCSVTYAFFVELAQFFGDDQTLRDRRKQSTGLDEPIASKRCS